MIVDFEQTRIEQMSTLLRKVVLKNTVVASTSGSPDGCSNKTLSEIGMVLSQNSSTANELFSNKSSTRANWQLSLEFTLDKSMIDLAMLFSLVEENVDSLRISDWGISPTTLEDVFVKVVERDLAETAARH